jgi:hypothetical protein
MPLLQLLLWPNLDENAEPLAVDTEINNMYITGKESFNTNINLK